MNAPRTIRGQVAVAGIGETAYYKHRQAPESEVQLALGLNAARLFGFDVATLRGGAGGRP